MGRVSVTHQAAPHVLASFAGKQAEGIQALAASLGYGSLAKQTGSEVAEEQSIAKDGCRHYWYH